MRPRPRAADPPPELLDFRAWTAALGVYVERDRTQLKLPTIDDYRAVMDLNLKAVIFVTQAVTRRMAEYGTKGSVINMSSQMGHVGAANRTLYCASKWALAYFGVSARIIRYVSRTTSGRTGFSFPPIERART